MGLNRVKKVNEKENYNKWIPQKSETSAREILTKTKITLT